MHLKTNKPPWLLTSDAIEAKLDPLFSVAIEVEQYPESYNAAEDKQDSFSISPVGVWYVICNAD